MDVLCPSCQKKLTLPDAHAGQPAKCPECNSTFTAPALPAMPAAGFVPPPPPPSPPPFTPAPVLTPTPAAAPAPHPFDGEGFAHSPPVPAPQETRSAASPASSVAPAPAEYTHRLSAHANPRVLQPLAALAVLGLFVLSFFPWVGRYPGGVPVVTQSAWQAAFGAETVDEDLKKMLSGPAPGKDAPSEERPGASGLMILFVLLLILALLGTLAAAAWNVIPVALPASAQAFKPWRWGIAAALLLLTLVLLVLQEVSGFNLEARTTAEVDRSMEGLKKLADVGGKAADEKRIAILRGTALTQLYRTAALRWATALNALALVCALLVYWVERRRSRPVPRVDLLW